MGALQRVLVATTRVLAALGFTPRVLKTALAAGLAWELAVLRGGAGHPYFAPLAAVLALDVTVEASLARGLQRVLGVATGILLALALARVLSATAFGVGLVVLAATALATRFGYGPQAVTQVAISALLVLTVGRHVPGYALDRAADTLIGAAVAVVLNALVIPPDPTPRAAAAMAELGGALADAMRALGEAGSAAERMERLASARRLGRMLAQARARVRTARSALVLSPLTRWRDREVRRYLAGMVALERAVAHVRGGARVLARLEAAPPAALAPALATAAGALGAWTGWILSPSPRRRIRLARSVRALRQAVLRTQADLVALDDPRSMAAGLAVAVDLEELAEDLDLAARRGTPRKGAARRRSGGSGSNHSGTGRPLHGRGRQGTGAAVGHVRALRHGRGRR